MNDHVYDHGSRRYVEELEALHLMLRDYPMESEIASIRVAVDAAEVATIRVELAARRLPEVASGLIEWTRSLGRPVGSVWRSEDGQTARIRVRGIADESDTPVTAWAGPVPYRLLIGVDVAVGGSALFDTDQLYLWAIDVQAGPV